MICFRTEKVNISCKYEHILKLFRGLKMQVFFLSLAVTLEKSCRELRQWFVFPDVIRYTHAMGTVSMFVIVIIIYGASWHGYQAGICFHGNHNRNVASTPLLSTSYSRWGPQCRMLAVVVATRCINEVL